MNRDRHMERSLRNRKFSIARTEKKMYVRVRQGRNVFEALELSRVALGLARRWKQTLARTHGRRFRYRHEAQCCQDYEVSGKLIQSYLDIFI